MRLIHHRLRPACPPHTDQRRTNRRGTHVHPTRRTSRLRLASWAAIVSLTAVAFIVAAEAASADTIVLAVAGSVDEVLTNIRNWVVGILAGLATCFLTVGGVRYVMAGGDPGEIEKAKTAVKAAGIGYALAALAPLVVSVLKSLVGA
jgi:cyanate permease